MLNVRSIDITYALEIIYCIITDRKMFRKVNVSPIAAYYFFFFKKNVLFPCFRKNVKRFYENRGIMLNSVIILVFSGCKVK